MDEHTIMREAPWMVPVLIASGVTLLALIAALIVYIWTTFRSDIKDRLSAQDAALAGLIKTVGDIKELLQAEFSKIRDRLWEHHAKIGDHHSRLRRLEEHTGLGPGHPPRRLDDQDTGD